MGQISDKLCCLSALSTSPNHPGDCLTPLYNNCSWYGILCFYTHSCIHFVYMFCVLLCMGLYKPSIYLFFTLKYHLKSPQESFNLFSLPDVNIVFCLSDYLVSQGHLTGTKSILLNFKNVKNVCVYLNIHIIYKKKYGHIFVLKNTHTCYNIIFSSKLNYLRRNF